MTGSAPAAGRSRTGAASTVMPSSARSSAISRADRYAASSALGSGSAAIAAGGRIGAPFRRAQARDPAALLVDQNRRVRPPDGVAQLIDQGAHLIAAGAIAPEQHEAERIATGEKPPFVRGQPLAGNAKDNRERPLAGHGPRVSPGNDAPVIALLHLVAQPLGRSLHPTVPP